MRWFGLVSLVGVIVTAVVRVDELTSPWCVYVAIVSVLILEHFRRLRASEVCDLRSGMVLLGSAAGPASPDTRAVCDGNRVSTLAYAIRRPVRPNRAHTPRVQQHRRLSAPSTLSLFRARVRLLATRSAANPTQQRSCAPSPKR